MMQLRDFKALTFDCYGTLIDWETGLYAALQPLLRKGGVTLPREAVLAAFARHESAQEAATPQMIYSTLLAEVHRRLAREWNVSGAEAEAVAFGRSVPDWPAFPDTVAALQYLQRYYKLIILSNVDRDSFAGSNARLGVTFDAVYTAQDIGSYKPDPRNFTYLINGVAGLGVLKRNILHTAQSLYHDHVPAQAAGLSTAWIDRRHEQEGWGATTPPAGTPRYDFRFTSLAEMVQAHQQELRA
ncbi:MAG TPA: haloacid dehalogenase type II [Steroidobacteraceae bacterium]|nr:haloacid dehalogenase type II [Steroidobacteraceae bacterium]